LPQLYVLRVVVYHSSFYKLFGVDLGAEAEAAKVEPKNILAEFCRAEGAN